PIVLEPTYLRLAASEGGQNFVESPQTRSPRKYPSIERIPLLSPLSHPPAFPFPRNYRPHHHLTNLTRKRRHQRLAMKPTTVTLAVASLANALVIPPLGAVEGGLALPAHTFPLPPNFHTHAERSTESDESVLPVDNTEDVAEHSPSTPTAAERFAPYANNTAAGSANDDGDDDNNTAAAAATPAGDAKPAGRFVEYTRTGYSVTIGDRIYHYNYTKRNLWTAEMQEEVEDDDDEDSDEDGSFSPSQFLASFRDAAAVPQRKPLLLSCHGRLCPVLAAHSTVKDADASYPSSSDDDDDVSPQGNLTKRSAAAAKFDLTKVNASPILSPNSTVPLIQGNLTSRDVLADANPFLSPNSTVPLIQGNLTSRDVLTDANPFLSPNTTVPLLHGNLTSRDVLTDANPFLSPNTTVPLLHGNLTSRDVLTDANPFLSPNTTVPLLHGNLTSRDVLTNANPFLSPNAIVPLSRGNLTSRSVVNGTEAGQHHHHATPTVNNSTLAQVVIQYRANTTATTVAAANDTKRDGLSGGFLGGHLGTTNGHQTSGAAQTYRAVGLLAWVLVAAGLWAFLLYGL
ncbi:hypothetical protein F4780DRAFT_785683, partial [Xylariomycetidae sp. FL0641]